MKVHFGAKIWVAGKRKDFQPIENQTTLINFQSTESLYFIHKITTTTLVLSHRRLAIPATLIVACRVAVTSRRRRHRVSR
jgi:hypothetical protein